jgi:hypothetical protein
MLAPEADMRRSLSVVTIAGILMSGCVQTFPGGIAETRPQAIALVDQYCGKAFQGVVPERWAATLHGDHWQLSQRDDGMIFSASIDAKTGKLADDACIATPDDG